VGILIRQGIPYKLIAAQNHVSYESIHMEITCMSVMIKLIVVYRIPPSPKNGLRNSMFLSELAELLESQATTSG